jgi:hypothetical protein
VQQATLKIFDVTSSHENQGTNLNPQSCVTVGKICQNYRRTNSSNGGVLRRSDPPSTTPTASADHPAGSEPPRIAIRANSHSDHASLSFSSFPLFSESPPPHQNRVSYLVPRCPCRGLDGAKLLSSVRPAAIHCHQISHRRRLSGHKVAAPLHLALHPPVHRLLGVFYIVDLKVDHKLAVMRGWEEIIFEYLALLKISRTTASSASSRAPSSAAAQAPPANRRKAQSSGCRSH